MHDKHLRGNRVNIYASDMSQLSYTYPFHIHVKVGHEDPRKILTKICFVLVFFYQI